MDDDDRRLVTGMLGGEQAAFDDFFNKYFDRLYRFALVRLDQDTHAAEDAVQQTLCRAMQKIELFRGDAALFTWLCRICRNTIADSFRGKDQRMSDVVPFEETDEIRVALEALSSGATGDPHDSVLSDQIKRVVHVILDYLPTRYGLALELKYIRGFSVSEVADELEIPPKAAESLLARARAAFKEGFAELGNNDVLDGIIGEVR